MPPVKSEISTLPVRFRGGPPGTPFHLIVWGFVASQTVLCTGAVGYILAATRAVKSAMTWKSGSCILLVSAFVRSWSHDDFSQRFRAMVCRDNQ